MQIILSVECDNAAFEDDPRELARDLRSAADKAEAAADFGPPIEEVIAHLDGRKVYDTNGNAVGTFTAAGE